MSPRLIIQFSDSATLEYDKGFFDHWCVYLTPQGGARYAPTDAGYFAAFQTLASTHGARKIYDDFVKIYDKTTNQIEQEVLREIESVSASYGQESLEIQKLLSLVYAGMVAEENKAYAVLKKRIKRLGMHQILIENATPAYAASYSKGKKAWDLFIECESRGF
jgi:hypothetical protein